MRQAAVSFLLCEITQGHYVEICLTVENKTGQDKRRDTVKENNREGWEKDIGRKEGEGGDLEEFGDLLDLVAQSLTGLS